MDPPEWALLERELLRQHTTACVKFFRRYFNQANGWLETTERFGGDDGPDDAIENVNDWPHLYALGGDEVIREMYTKAYNGHVQQFMAAKTTDVPIGRLGTTEDVAGIASFLAGDEAGLITGQQIVADGGMH